MSNSVFTKVINREIPAEIIWENEKVIILMDAFPLVDGQVLVVPKAEVDHFFDLDEETYNEVFKIVKWISPILKKTFNTKRVIMIVEGFEVPHVHVKLYPANEGNTHFLPTNKVIQSKIKENAEKIRNNIN